MTTPRAFGRYSFNPYAAFFTVVVFVFMCIMLAFVMLAMMKDSSLLELAIGYPLSCLFAVTIMMNLGNQKASAKELFWGWITVTFGFASLAGIGYGMLYSIGVI